MENGEVKIMKYILENGKLIKQMVMEDMIMQMVVGMKENSKIILNLEKEEKHMQMVIFMMEIL